MREREREREREKERRKDEYWGRKGWLHFLFFLRALFG